MNLIRIVCVEQEKMKKALAISLLLNAAPSLAYAAGGGGHATFADIIPYWINFSLYVLVLVLLLKKPISKGWASRTEGIATAVNKGKTEREHAEQVLRAAKNKESSIQVEIKGLVAQIENETKAEVGEILSAAHEQAQRIIAQGRDMLTAEQKAFENALRKELADEVLKRATEILKRDVDASTDAPLRSSSISIVGQLLN